MTAAAPIARDMEVPLLDAHQDWFCPNCGLTERTKPLAVNEWRYHTCPRLHMLTAPLLRAGEDAKVVAVERENYLGEEIQTTGDDGRPYMGIHTVYADGHNDVIAHPGSARAFGRD